MRYLIDHGADAACVLKSDTALNQAAKGGNVQVVSLLIEEGARVDKHALCAAVEKGHYEVAGTLLTYGADPNCFLTPGLLVRAAKNNFLAIGTFI